jgi:hypothetical protein
MYGSQSYIYTFQAVIVSNGIDTYLMYNYDNQSIIRITWYSAYTGFDSGNDYNLFNGNTSIVLANASNVNVNGKWIFKVDTNNYYSFTTPSPVTNSIFFAFGSAAGDLILTKGDDICYGSISIGQYIPYFDSYYSSFYVCVNGKIGLGYQVYQIYPFNIDLDTTYTGIIYYRRLRSTDLNNVKSDINLVDSTFTPTSGLVVTWYRVPRYGTQSYIYTFQALLVSNGFDTYLIYNYDDQTMPITWSSNYTGFDSGNGTNLFKRNSSINMATSSNVNVNGKWIFKVNSATTTTSTTTTTTQTLSFSSYSLNIRLLHTFNDSLNDPSSAYYIQIKNNFTSFVNIFLFHFFIY